MANQHKTSGTASSTSNTSPGGTTLHSHRCGKGDGPGIKHSYTPGSSPPVGCPSGVEGRGG